MLSGFASKVVVAPKVGFLPQKSFHILIAFADYDYQPEFLSLFWCWPLGFTLVGLLVGLKSTAGLSCGKTGTLHTKLTPSRQPVNSVSISAFALEIGSQSLKPFLRTDSRRGADSHKEKEHKVKYGDQASSNGNTQRTPITWNKVSTARSSPRLQRATASLSLQRSSLEWKSTCTTMPRL